MTKPVRLSPGQALSLWYDQRGSEESKVIAFANALANHYLSTNHRHVPLSDLQLPTLYYGALRRAGYKWIHEVAPLPETSLRTIRHIGSVGATVITDSIARFHRDKN
jgi:hypothetical protein